MSITSPQTASYQFLVVIPRISPLIPALPNIIMLACTRGGGGGGGVIVGLCIRYS